MTLTAPISPGELIDKLTILDIKRDRITDPSKLANVETEHAVLTKVAETLDHPDLAALRARLTGINEALWDIEDDIRLCEERREFGPAFIALARSVYITNDERAAVKRLINEAFGSELIEEKSYAGPQ